MSVVIESVSHENTPHAASPTLDVVDETPKPHARPRRDGGGDAAIEIDDVQIVDHAQACVPPVIALLEEGVARKVRVHVAYVVGGVDLDALAPLRPQSPKPVH